MKLLRLILALILTFTIPLEGWAAIDMSGTTGPCPMQMDTTQNMAMSMEQDCCDVQQATAANSTEQMPSSSPCKFGQACQVGQIFPFTALSVTVHPLTLTIATSIVMPSQLILPSRDPSGLWRPPRSF